MQQQQNQTQRKMHQSFPTSISISITTKYETSLHTAQFWTTLSVPWHFRLALPSHLEHPSGLGNNAAAAEEADDHDDQADEHQYVDAGPVVLHAQTLHPLLKVLVEPDPEAQRENNGAHQLSKAGHALSG